MNLIKMQNFGIALRVLQLFQGEFPTTFSKPVFCIPNFKNHFKAAQAASTAGKARQENFPCLLSVFRQIWESLHGNFCSSSHCTETAFVSNLKT